jgi:T-complex protein 1 subunit gamma
MLKMLLDPMGGIVMTNDGNSILREIDVAHPAAKSIIELSRTQDEEVGDGTTSVVILASEFLNVAEAHIKKNVHPRHIVDAYYKVMEDALDVLKKKAINLDLNNRKQILDLVRSTLGTKFVSRFGDLICNMAIDAILKVMVITESKKKEIDTKRYARIEKIAGGLLEDSVVLDGIALNKDVLDAKMPRKFQNPRILVLDCPLEYRKAESQTNVEISKEEDFEELLEQEEAHVKKQCDEIIKFKPNVVFTEKGCSDLAIHFLSKAGISCLRRLKKTDSNRLARATGATVVSETNEIKESDIGTKCGLFEVKKIGDEYWSFIVECKEPKACTILLRGGSKDVLSEMERNLDDAMSVVKNIMLEPKIVPGGGATELAIEQALLEKSKSITGVQQWPYRSAAQAFEVIPRTLIENCGASTIRVLTALRAKHAEGKNSNWGVDGNKGEIAEMNKINVWDSYTVKAQTIKTAIEAAAMLLRIDEIVSGISKKDK